MAKKHKVTLADCVTLVRIALALLLPFCGVFTPLFYAVYAICGATDIMDGFIARKTNTCTKAGARLDSLADIVFCAVCLCLLLPVSDIAPWLWAATAVVAAIRLTGIIIGLCRYKRLVLLHTKADKAAGMALFIVPFAACAADINLVALPVLLLTLFAAVWECYRILSGRVTV